MSNLTSTQQQPALGRYQRGDGCYSTSRRSTGRTEGTKDGGAGAFLASAPAPRLVNEIKLTIVGVMSELRQPVTSGELQALLKEFKVPLILDYHLSTLVRVGAAEMIDDSDELRFRLNRRQRT